MNDGEKEKTIWSDSVTVANIEFSHLTPCVENVLIIKSFSHDDTVLAEAEEILPIFQDPKCKKPEKTSPVQTRHDINNKNNKIRASPRSSAGIIQPRFLAMILVLIAKVMHC